ncbi:MAG: tRNA (guanosine(46)-N7)-methyltransferase TrmB [Xanthomonadales bacterium]|jgi:tRNA (guanine-N7-)-methyltransferase|nr:tRNA (guanosine(46)-N7)-methyltransferase TrmB [Xanthomonadales bacterium]
MEQHPHIRSFARVSGRGRLSDAQRRALEDALPTFQWRLEETWRPQVVEIGFGNGEALLSAAATAPMRNFLGIEVYAPGVGYFLSRAQALGLSNVRVAREDALLLLPRLENSSVEEFRLWFPDPWPKKRHHKRRIVQPGFVQLLLEKLQVGGRIHFATDVQDYAEQMLQVLSAAPRLRNSVTDGFAPRPDSRPLTRFEQRGLRLGHAVFDLLFDKLSD